MIPYPLTQEHRFHQPCTKNHHPLIIPGFDFVSKV